MFLNFDLFLITSWSISVLDHKLIYIWAWSQIDLYLSLITTWSISELDHNLIYIWAWSHLDLYLSLITTWSISELDHILIYIWAWSHLHLCLLIPAQGWKIPEIRNETVGPCLLGKLLILADGSNWHRDSSDNLAHAFHWHPSTLQKKIGIKLNLSFGTSVILAKESEIKKIVYLLFFIWHMCSIGTKIKLFGTCRQLAQKWNYLFGTCLQLAQKWNCLLGTFSVGTKWNCLAHVFSWHKMKYKNLAHCLQLAQSEI